ncbi:MAG: LysM peptidoglycan-binding domain-containing protein [Myxococcaceae bacterium]
MFLRRGLLAALLLAGCGPADASFDGGADPRWRVYRVDHGTLTDVALATGVGVGALQSINSLRGDTVRAGTGLLVPASDRTENLPVYVRPAAAPEWQACGRVRFVVDATACTGAVCIRPPEDPDADDAALDVTVGDAHFSMSLGAQLLGGGEVLVSVVDLDGDGDDETVVSVRQGSGNGLGLEWWHHAVVSDGELLSLFESSDFGGGSFVQQERGCALMVVSTDWRADQLRGDGLYFVAQLHVVRERALEAVGPEVVRRTTRRFEDQRWHVLEREPHARDVLSWFTDRGAFAWPDVGEVSCVRDTILTVSDEHELGLASRDEPLGPELTRLVDARTGAARLEDPRPGAWQSLVGRHVLSCTRTGSDAVEVRLER